MQIPIQHTKRCSTSLVTRENQSHREIALPVHWDRHSQKPDSNSYGWGGREMGTRTLLVGMENATAALENSLAVS